MSFPRKTSRWAIRQTHLNILEVANESWGGWILVGRNPLKVLVDWGLIHIRIVDDLYADIKITEKGEHYLETRKAS